jgi:hypothetical protein
VKKWNREQAIALCIAVEALAPTYGAHVALTGGLLYKEGKRKDADLLFYCIRQVDRIDEEGLLKALETIGLQVVKQHGWVRKAKWFDKDVDLFFPEAYPARADSGDAYNELAA